MMITTADATKAILAAVKPLASENVALEQATGRVLSQGVSAERDQPPFDRVTMDGIAITYAEFAQGTRSFPIQSMQAAGESAQPAFWLLNTT